jgi:hypothetical protein
MSNAEIFLEDWEDSDRGTFDKKGLVAKLEEFEKELNFKKLEQYYNATVGMFATDRPDLVDDSTHRVLFELERI